MSALGNCIKQLREKASLSLQEVADRAALSKAHIWEIESGGNTNPTIKTLCCIAIALGVDADGLASAAISDCMNKIPIQTVRHEQVVWPVQDEKLLNIHKGGEA